MNKAAFKEIDKLFKELDSRPEGLSFESISIRKDEYGVNKIVDKNKRTYLRILLSQFDNFFNYILLGAAVIVFFLGDYVDFWVIVAIILINSIIGFVQEGKANKVFEILQKNIKSEAIVLRGGKKQKVLDEDVVVGDVIFLKDGDKIPADARLFEANNLKVNESSLTGESSTVLKEVKNLKDENLEISDQKNMVFKGTHIVSGLAKALVVAVGDKTQIGQVAKKIEDIDSDLPIKKNIKNLSRIIILFVILFSLITLLFGLGYNFEAEEIFLIVVALFVSAIPESLPIILTVVLAAGFHRMSKKNVLVKKLQAVDALGQTNIIALDKTGTITKNQMKVEKVFVDDKFYYVTGDGYEPIGKVLCKDKAVDIYKENSFQLLSKIAVSTSIGDFSFNEEGKIWELNFGDPTEVAMIVFGEKVGLKKDDLYKQYPLINEIPFDMNYKHHSVILDVEGDHKLFSAGAPEALMQASSKILRNGNEIIFDNNEKQRISDAINVVTKDGYRVLAMAYKNGVTEGIDPNDMQDLVFVGFLAINDTIRKSVNASIEALEHAGMKAVMITGDYVETAIGIAKKVGIWEEDSVALTGKDMSSMNDRQLLDKLKNTAVFARVTPEQKLKIISLYKQRGDIIAMTGDGVNDVLSLVKADLGVSMGYGATDVAKEAADIILLDNNFGSLAFGVLEGRNIYKNIKKTVEYLLSTNMAELLVVMLSLIVGLPVALTAVQILWLNLVTDSFLALGFAFEPLDNRLSKIKDWRPSKYLLDKKSLFKIFTIAFVMTSITMIAYMDSLDKGIVYAHSMVLAVITVMQIYTIANIKSGDKSIFKTNFFNNKFLFFGIFASLTLFLFAMYNPFFQNILDIKPITWGDWLYVLGFGLVLILTEEIRKLFSK